MELQERLKLAQEAGPKYEELASMFEAAITEDVAKLSQYRTHASAGVRFSAFTNRLTEVSLADLDSDPLVKYAAIYNPSTSTQILDHIGLNKTSVNPIIPEAIHVHKNASKEFQVFRAITDFGIQDDLYEEENEKFFHEAIYDDFNDLEVLIDLECLESLFYLYTLGHIEGPDETGVFWQSFYETIETNLEKMTEMLKMFANLPAIPEKIYTCGTVTRARCIAAEVTHDASIIEKLAWDTNTISTGVGGFYWLDSTSPRSSAAWNTNASPEILLRLFLEESKNEESLRDYPPSVFWRLAGNPSSPQEVFEGIIGLIEDDIIKDVDGFSQLSLLVGEENDMNTGLAWNPSITGEARLRVEKLMQDRGLDPADYKDLLE